MITVGLLETEVFKGYKKKPQLLDWESGDDCGGDLLRSDYCKNISNNAKMCDIYLRS